jgi:hypothetical protein
MLMTGLSDIEVRLRAIVEACQEAPRAIDGYVLDSANGVSVDNTITQAYRILKDSVYSEGSSLRASSDVWEAFIEQRDEFLEFYFSALRALEIYKEVLLTYNLSRSAHTSSGKGDLEQIRQDKRTQVDERQECIIAVREFQGKFSAMLTILS